MNKLILLLLILVMIPVVLAGTQDDLYNSAPHIYLPSVNLTNLNTSANLVASILRGNPTFNFNGGNSFTEFDDNSLLLPNRPSLDTNNFSGIGWFQVDATNRLHVFASSRPSSLADGDFWWTLDDRTDTNFYTFFIFDAGTSITAQVATTAIQGGHYNCLSFVVNWVNGGLTTVNLSINGTKVTSQNVANNIPIIPTGRTIAIGEDVRDSPGESLDGKVKGFVLFNRTLTVAEQQWYCDQGEDFDLVPEVIDDTPPDNTFGNLTSEGGEGQILFDYNASGYGFITHKLGEPANLPDREANYDGINMSGNVLLLHFDGNSTSDHSGNGNDGTVFGGANFTPDGKINGGYMFNGIDGCISITNDASLITGVNDFSITTWFKTNSSVNMFIFSSDDITDNSHDIYLQITEVLRCFVRDADNNNRIIRSSTVNVNDGKWHYASCVFDISSQVMSVYLDGTLNQGSQTTTGSIVNLEPDKDFGIGCDRVGGIKRFFFNGTIDEVAIFNRSLSAGEIQRIYQQGNGYRPSKTNDTTPTFNFKTDEASTCALYSSNRINVSDNNTVLLMTFDQNATDESRYGRDGNITGATHIGSSYEFDKDTMTTVDFLNLSKDFTYMFRFQKFDNLTALESTSALVFNSFNDGHFRGNYREQFCGDGIRWRWDPAGTGIICQQFPKTHTWYWVTLTKSSGDETGSLGIMKSYTDGVLVNTRTQAVNDTYLYALQGFNVYAGFNGTIDEIYAFQTNLSVDVILDIIENGLSPDLNYSQMVYLNASRECSTTGSINHICTVPTSDELDIGLASGFLGCKDEAGNENRTSSSGMFYINLTDPVPPQVNLAKPNDNAVFQIGVNNTIRFNATATDNVDNSYNCTGYVNQIQEFSNATYTNGTEFNWTKIVPLGDYTWNITCIDSFGNINSSARSFSVEQQPSVYLNLNGLNLSRKYEYRTKANISANCTQQVGETCQVSIDIIAPRYGINVSHSDNVTSIIFNITTLRRVNFSHGPTEHTLTNSGTVNVTSDNRTIMQSVQLNVISSGSTTNLNISYLGIAKQFRGTIKGIYLTFDKFIHEGEEKDAVNLTYTSAGSKFIFSDLTDIDNANNLSFDITGFDLDGNNEFTYIEYFNGSDGTSGINDTIIFQAESPFGILDDFTTNNSKWDITAPAQLENTLIRWVNGYLEIRPSPPTTSTFDIKTVPNSGEADLRNSSYLSFEFDYLISCSTVDIPGTSGNANVYIDITDGISSVNIKTYSVSCGRGQGASDDNYYNFSLLNRNVIDDDSWELFINGSTQGTKNLVSLDFSKRIYPQFRQTKQITGSGNSEATLKLHEILLSGGWLGRNQINGTYNTTGNVTSNTIEVTTDNLQRATLTAIDYIPPNTTIDYYLSNDCVVYEPVTNGLLHTFSSTGKKVCWRAVLNSSVNITSPVVKRVTINTVASTGQNITVDLGNDGSNEFEFFGDIDATTGVLIVNLSPTSNTVNTIKISLATSGQIQIDNFKINATINPVTLNATAFEDCYFCNINFTFGGDNLLINDLKWDFLGSWNYSIIARFGNLIDEKILQVFYSDFNLSLPKNINWYDVFPSSKDSKNVTPFGQTSDTPIWNITNLAYDEEIDVYVKTNESFDLCMNGTFTNNSVRIVSVLNESFTWINLTTVFLNNINIVNGSDRVFNQTSGETIGNTNYSMSYIDGTIKLNSTFGDRSLFGINYSYYLSGFDTGDDFTFELNTSYQKILDTVSIDFVNPGKTSRGLWNYWSFTNCSAGVYLPYFDFAATCSACFFEESQLDNYNIIRE